MMKNILTIALSVMLLSAVPAVSSAREAIEIAEFAIDSDQPTISVNQNVLHVTNANNQVVYIYNVAGVRIQCFKVDGDDRHIELNLPKGCYIVKVGKAVRKITIR